MFSKKTITVFLAIYIVLMTFLALGNFDFNFSYAIINPHSPWANFFNLFGEMPANLLMLAGVTILFGSRKRDSMGRQIASYAVALPIMAFISWFIVYLPVNYMYENHETGLAEGMPPYWIAIISVIAAIVFSAALIFQKRLSPEKLMEMKKAAILFIVLVAGEIILVNVIKIIWGRPRMRMIESIDEFRKWYEIHGPAPTNDHKSFPSGHTANGFATIGFVLFFSYFKRINAKAVMAFALAWGTLVALSRVVLGAHFLSDVITGGYITIFLFLILNALFFPKPKA